jgi:asparaginyl-tRNA synthetase
MSLVSPVRIADLFLNHAAHLGSTVKVQGWVRTRRDSKAGISFVAVTDGSCFDTVQAVVPNTLTNYESEILRLTAGCSVEITGLVVASQGKGQAVELQATEVTVHGFVDDPDTYPISPKQHSFEYLREVAHLRPRTNTFGRASLLQRERIPMGAHADHHWQRLRRRGTDVSRLDA